jgi:hypothetical protein
MRARQSAYPGLLFIALVPFAVLGTSGCNMNMNADTTPTASAVAQPLQGRVSGGEQPLVGATIQLYTAGAPTSGGAYGQGATARITGTLPVTDVNGNFAVASYTLPSVPSLWYLVASGGSPGNGNPANPGAVLMAAISGCTATSSLSSSLFVNINEVTTMATVAALQPFIAAPAPGNVGAPVIGAPSTNIVGLQNAFETVGNLANITTGSAVTPVTDYAATTANAQRINTLADILVHCVNSDPGGSSNCSTLYADATPTGALNTAADISQAAWYIAQNPSNNVSALFGLVPTTPPFVALTSVPSNYSIGVVTSGSACQTPVPLGFAGGYAILAGTTVTNASTNSDQTVITGGDVGVSPGTAETGFVTGTYTATIDNSGAGAAELDLTTAYNTAAGLALPAALPGDMSGLTFTPGLYKTSSAVTLNSGSVTLDAQGDPNAAFVFQIGTTLITAGGTQVILINGAQAQNVFWQVGSSATVGGASAFAGNIIAYTSITFDTDSTLLGRALASNGAVTLLSTTITAP